MVGRDEAWKEVWAYHDELVRFAKLRYGLNQDDAEDAVSDTMLKIATSMRHIRSLRPLLFRATANVIIDKLRQEGRRGLRISGWRAAITQGEGGAFDAMLLGGTAECCNGLGSSGEVPGGQNDMTRRTPCEMQPIEAIELRSITETLPDDMADVIWLDYFQCTAREGAEALGITVPAYKGTLYRARVLLRSRLSEK